MAGRAGRGGGVVMLLMNEIIMAMPITQTTPESSSKIGQSGLTLLIGGAAGCGALGAAAAAGAGLGGCSAGGAGGGGRTAAD